MSSGPGAALAVQQRAAGASKTLARSRHELRNYSRKRASLYIKNDGSHLGHFPTAPELPYNHDTGHKSTCLFIPIA
ncbi:hypothetical protein ACU8KH_01005 [Lachancea thermotolerans]